ncbi:MAG TPA: hypothetical protein VNQ57_12985 [Ureibacillus sp.]|uniref:hypothetical protein n=1 Tax=Neobacillus sp. MER 74 TaxID=2939566 RepID=UPI00203E4169|nr:hypothetical protein [Neobacillus sp. MER 74]MCM3118859.1 hypothetical protein [Neobacillus sp. MER 74]HWL13902.1 hypothetical protein [Ureibacillus sp.]
MKRYIILLLVFILFFVPKSVSATNEGYEMVTKLPKEDIILYAKKMNGLYQDFKIVFKGETYFRPFWINDTNPTYAPKLFYEDINKDGKKEIIITLTKGYGSGVLDEEVYVYRYTNGLIDVIVDNPLAIIYKNVKTKLTTEKAEIILGDKVSIIDTKSIEPSHLFEDIGFGSIIDYEVIKKNLMVRVSGQITPAMFVGDIIITYEYRDKMYQAKTIEFITDINKNPFYGPVKH